MKNDFLFLMFVSILLLCGLFLLAEGNRVLREGIVQNNCAQYNPQTGDFEWKDSK